jgi:hypothetical protein
MLSLILSLALSQTILDSTTKSLEVVTTTTAAVDYFCSYVDFTSGAATPGDTQGAITTATTTTYVSAPAASTQRQLRRCSFRNKSTSASNKLTFQKDVSATNYEAYSVTLAPGESVKLDAEGEWGVYDSSGIRRVAATTVIDGRTVTWLKVGATSEAAGLLQHQNKDTGTPGAWVPGTPGLNGDAVSCNTTADAAIAGAPYLPDPASGNYYLTAATAGASVAGMPYLVDLIWFNTGLVVTTTTAQNITTPTLGARDQEGSTNGNGVMLGILVTTATTNGSAVTNMTASYTDSDGNAGNTATVASFPATAVAGAFVPFQLAAGDRGVRSVESVTLGTSLAAGAVSMVLFRPIVYVSAPVANIGGTLSVVNSAPSGVKLWNGTCLNAGYLASATTATTLNLNAQLTVR